MDYVDVSRDYRLAAQRIGLLSREEEVMLVHRWQQQGDTRARDKIIVAHQHIVVKAANKFSRFPSLREDLLQQGTIGLTTAIDKFNPDYGFRFSTYSYHWAFASMQEFASNNSSIVRRSRSGQNISDLKKARKELGYEFRDLDQEAYKKIAESLGWDVSKVVALVEKNNTYDSSLSAPISEDSHTTGEDLLVDTRANPEQILLGDEAYVLRRQWVANAMAILTPREQAIIQARILDEDTSTLETLTHQFGVSRERIRQIEVKAKDKIKGFLKTALPYASNTLYDPDSEYSFNQ